MYRKTAKKLLKFIEKSPTAFQAVTEMTKRLDKEGFEELKEEDHWKLKKGGNYYVTRNHSAIIAFSIPQKPVWKFHDDNQDFLVEILEACAKAGNPDLVYKFTSTSKVSFPGSGIAAVAASKANLEDFRSYMQIQTIGHDKLNQLRHVKFFKNIDGLHEHMRKHAAILRPKFEMVLNTLDRELGGLGIGEWTKPHGGYFISFDSMEGCAKAIVAKAKEAGVVLTGAGATYPYGKDPKDSNIRIAPSYPSVEELGKAAEVFVLCVKLVSVEKLLEK